METVYLDLGEHSYPIHIGRGLLNDGELLRSMVGGQQALIVTNNTIAPLYLESLRAVLQPIAAEVVILPDGEAFKTLATLEKIFDELLTRRHNRGTTLLALGGGVVGDMTGFAAASYQRGVGFIQLPTTLLAQVDSSVGGKTAVNHPLGKNMIGAFHQPLGVVIDTDTLATLPPRELSAGFAEVVKHGALADLAYFDWLEGHVGDLLGLNPSALAHAIKRSCEIKAGIVALDEREAGVRALLNLGHTFGHAIENGMGYGEWLHGEAVATGMVMAADLSCRLGMIDREAGRRLKRLLVAFGLPVTPPAALANQFLDLMQRDKKANDEGLRFVLLAALGSAKLISGIDPFELQSTLNAGEALLAD